MFCNSALIEESKHITYNFCVQNVTLKMASFLWEFLYHHNMWCLEASHERASHVPYHSTDVTWRHQETVCDKLSASSSLYMEQTPTLHVKNHALCIFQINLKQKRVLCYTTKKGWNHDFEIWILPTCVTSASYNKTIYNLFKR